MTLAREVFETHMKGANFMTPDIVKYVGGPGIAIELSSGENFERNGTNYGVTVLTIEGKRTEMSRAFTGAGPREAAEAYIRELIGS